jgi:predicted protein tyrosine phosphatase
VIRRRTLSQTRIEERWLFVCSMNYLRSPTAECVARKAGFWADSCGTDEGAGKRLTQERVDWADVIVCMEEEHRRHVRRLTKSRRVFNWHVPDDYGYMDEGLVRKLELLLGETILALDRMDEEEAAAKRALSSGAARPRYSIDEPQDQ